MDVLNKKLSWIISVAERIQTYFNSESNELLDITRRVANDHHAVIAYKTIACDFNTFMIICEDPKQLFKDIVAEVQKLNSKEFQNTLNPTVITTKLIDSEYSLDMNKAIQCYGIKSTVASNYLMKSISCKVISTLRGYYANLDDTSHMLKDIEELHPHFDYNTMKQRVVGGKKNKIKDKNRKNIRMDIIMRLIEYVRNHPDISKGIVFINNASECSNAALNIIYTERKYSEAIIDYLKLLITESFEEYKFKAFLHNDFNVPYSFMMSKRSCLVNDRKTDHPTYIANLYNIGTYAPVPCIKEVRKDKYIHVAHPIIKLRLLYLDMFMIEHKTKTLNPESHEALYQSKMLSAFGEVEAFDKTPTWVGYYKDEIYEKNQFNMNMKMTNPVDTMFI
jgi:hypothetical protein